MPPATRTDAEALGLRAATQAVSDIQSAWELMPRGIDADVARARIRLARYRAHAAPANTASRTGAALRDVALDARDRMGSSLRLLSSAETQLAEAHSIAR